MTQPTLTVELGYLSGWTLGTSLLGTDTYLATVDYSQDISDLVRSVSIRRGRQHELNRVEAGTASVMVLNQDGAMTRIPPMTAIRIRADFEPPGVFDPSDIAGLAAWYDMSSVSTLWQDTARTSAVTADGQTIKGVTDLSGTGHHLSEATNGPQYKTAIQNGLSIARFDGVNDTLKATFAGLTASTLFVIMRPTSTITDTYAVCLAGSYLSVLSGYVDGKYEWFENGTRAQAGNNSSSAFDDVVVTRPAHPGTYATYLDGVVGATAATGATTYEGVRLSGEFTGGSSPMNGDIAEVVLYDSVLSTANLNLVGQFLATKWGLSWTTIP